MTGNLLNKWIFIIQFLFFVHKYSCDYIPKDGEVWLIRVLGNDLPPLQSHGQTYNNTKFILENEAEFPGIKKAFMLNRIVSQREHDKLIDLFKKHNIPDDMIIDRTIDWSTPLQTREQISNYFQRINEARNIALYYGFCKGAKWVVLHDGNSFVPTLTMNETIKAMKDEKFYYISTPLVRLTQEQKSDWLTPETTLDDLLKKKKITKEIQEGTISFRFDAPKLFDERLTYAHRNKWNFLETVCGSPYTEKMKHLRVRALYCKPMDSPVVRLWPYPSNILSEIAIKYTHKRGNIRRTALDNFLNRILREVERRKKDGNIINDKKTITTTINNNNNSNSTSILPASFIYASSIINDPIKCNYTQPNTTITVYLIKKIPLTKAQKLAQQKAQEKKLEEEKKLEQEKKVKEQAEQELQLKLQVLNSNNTNNNGSNVDGVEGEGKEKVDENENNKNDEVFEEEEEEEEEFEEKLIHLADYEFNLAASSQRSPSFRDFTYLDHLALLFIFVLIAMIALWVLVL